MSAANRSTLFTTIHKVLRKHYEPVAPPSDRSVLEHLLYACVLEHARHETVDDVFARLQKNYFDWNEVRVTSVPELAEGMANIPDAVEAAKRLKRSLQSVFETHYVFDLEFLRKQGLAKTVETIEKYNGATPYVVAYVTQNALGGHAIPVNSDALALFIALGAVTEADAAKYRMPGLERAIAKSKGVEFGSLLQQFAVDFAANPQSAKVKGIVGEIDPDAKDRLPKKITRPDPARIPRQPEKPPVDTKSARGGAADKPAQATKEKADREKADREKADREKADREKSDREKADRDHKSESKKARSLPPAEPRKATAARITRKKPK